MTYKISFDKTKSYVELQWYGEVSIDDLIEAFTEIVKDKQFTPGISFLIDYREATPMLRYQDLAVLADFADKAPAAYFSAAVMKDDLDYSMAQIWSTYNLRLEKEHFAYFTNYKEAVNWLETADKK